MNKLKILKRIELIFRRELNDDKIELSFATTANEIDKWDSISNLILLVAIEEEFQISFPLEVIFEADNIGYLIEYIVQQND
jgi:acyl carrier protein